MKKIILSVISILTMLIMMPVVNADEQVPVYMFSKNGCSACISAVEYFQDLESEYPDLFELIEIEVFDAEWNFVSEDIQYLFLGVYEEFGEDTSKAATPTIVIGDYHTVGLPSDTSVVYDEIVKQSKAKEPVNKVEEIAKELEIDLENLPKAENNTNTENNTEETGKYDTLIIVGIFVVLIGGFAGLVIVGKK